MKTTKIISAISLVLVLTANLLFAGNISNPGSTIKQKLITYDVKVKFAPNFPGVNAHYLVAIVDENGSRVVPAQPFHPGVWSYTFKEAGTFKGTRIAVMVPYPANQAGWSIPRSVLKGMFYGGATYRFVLTPEAGENVRGGDE